MTFPAIFHSLQKGFLKNNSRLICFLLLLFICSHSSGQVAKEWVLKQKLDANNGLLPQNSAKDLYFDQHSGFLWITTEAGLVRYNGQTATTFDKRNLENLEVPRFYKFFRDEKRNVFAISTELRSNNLILVKIENDIPFIPRMDSAEKLNITGAISDNPKKFMISSKQQLGAGADKYFFSYNGKPAGAYTVGGLKHISYLAIENKLYSITGNDKALLFETAPFKVTTFKYDPLLTKKGIKYLSSDMSGNPFIKDGRTIYRISIANDRIAVSQVAVLPYDIDDMVSVATNPNNKELYCGGSTSGVHIFTLSSFYSYLIPDETIKQRNLNFPENILGYNNIYSVLVLNNGKYALTNEQSLFDLSDGSFIEHSVNPRQFSYPGAISYRLTNFQVNDNSYIWGLGVAVAYKTEFFPDKSFNVTTLGNIPPKNNCSFASDKTTWIFTDSSFGIFSGDSIRKVGDGLSWLPDSLRKITSERPLLATVLGPLNKTSVLLLFDNNFFSLDTARFVLKKIAELPKNDYRSFIRENDTYYWATTYGNGIFLIDIKENKVYTAPIDSRKNLLYAHTFAPDNKGNFLIPTNNGLFRINRQHLLELCLTGGRELMYEYFDTKNGLKGVEFNGGCIPAYNQLPDGDILFPSINGLVRLFTSSLVSEKKYPVYVESITTDRTSYPYSKGIRFASNNRTQNWQLNFAHWSNIYAGNVYYRLDNATNWIQLESPDNIITLSELAGGKHTLDIKVFFSLDKKEVATSSFQFYIDKRYYEQFWFWLLVLLSVTGLAYLVSFLRNRQIKKKNILLEKRIKEKTELLEEKNTNLEETLEEVNAMMEIIRDKSEFQKKLIRLIGHDVMIPLQFIAKTARQLGVYKDKLSTELRDETTEEINTTSTALMYLGQSIIQWIKLQETSYQVVMKDFHVLRSLQEIIPLHIKLLNTKDNKLDLQIDEELIFKFSPTPFQIIIHNLVMNANKFTINGVIQVKCYHEQNDMIIEVNDTGVGIDPAIAAELNNLRAVSHSSGTDNETGWGLGYKVIIELINASNGELHVSSQPGMGTKVKITIPG